MIYLESWGNSESVICASNAKISISKFDLIWPDMDLISANNQAEWHHYVKWTSLSIQNGPECKRRTDACDLFFSDLLWPVCLPLFTSRSYNSQAYTLELYRVIFPSMSSTFFYIAIRYWTNDCVQRLRQSEAWLQRRDMHQIISEPKQWKYYQQSLLYR